MLPNFQESRKKNATPLCWAITQHTRSGTAINSQSRFWVPSSLSHQQLTFVHRHHRRSRSYQTCLRGLWKWALGSERERERCRPLLEHPHWSFLMRVPSSLHTHPIQISLFKVSTASAPTFFIKLNHIENIVSSCLGRFSRRSSRKILDLMRYQQRRLRGRRGGSCANV